MSKRDYLNRGYRIDVMINAKLEQVSALKDLTTRLNTAFSDMPKNPNRDVSRMEENVVKIIALENEINDDIEKLLKVKEDIMKAVDGVSDTQERMLLTLRYLNFKTWEQIADELNCSIRNVHVIHGRALENVKIG